MFSCRISPQKNYPGLLYGISKYITDIQKNLIYREFNLEFKEDSYLVNLRYTKNYTLWGWGNETIELRIKEESLAKFIENQSINNSQQITESQSNFSWFTSTGEKIFTSYDFKQGIIELKMYNHNMSDEFSNMLQNDNVNIEYRYK